ncbi:putative Exo-beta-1,3-glucanase [Tricladium varicosporioides]|nr:putative Exo-beta-1,3-glucanase [Hymenoscyphus varicosporioides]
MIFPLVATLLAAQSAFAVPVDNEKRGAAPFNWGTDKMRGVNIGGWLIVEPFITPSIFESLDQSLGIHDEWTLGERLPQQAPQILQKHWDSFVGLADFQKIASAGFNMVRIPVGFWAYDNSNTPFVTGSAPYVDKAIDWARQTGLKVMIDLHAAPGSQNGWEHSGQAKADPGWLVDGGPYGPTSQKTLAVLKTIAQKYAQASYQDVIMGIGLLNEPKGWVLNNADLRQFYREGYGRVREVGDTTVILSDAFSSPASYNGFMTPQDNNVQRVAMDHHYYQIFSDFEVGQQPWQHRQEVCNTADNYWGADKWTFIGEFGAAMTDCAKHLNGYGNGARFDGTLTGQFHGTCADKTRISNWSSWYRDDSRKYIEAQLDAFEYNTQGWVFWNFKTESADEWSLFALMDNGIFPNPVTNRAFAPICSNYY